MIIYKGKNFNIHRDSNESKLLFICPLCGKMTEDIPVRLVYNGTDVEIPYHKECIKTVITEDRSDYGHIPPKDKIGAIKPNQNSLSIEKESQDKVHKDDGLKTYISTSKKKEALIHLFDQDRIGFRHDFDKKLMDKYIFYKKFKFHKPTKDWLIFIKNIDHEILDFIMKVHKTFENYDWNIDSNVIDIVKDRKNKLHAKNLESKEIRNLKKMTELDENQTQYDFSVLKIQPFGYQKVGISFLDKIGGVGLIGDEPGVGKTFSAIGYTTLFNLKTIIVCPASLKYNWFNEINKFTHKTATVLSEFDLASLDPKKLTTDYYIINYEQLEKYETFLKKAKFQCAVLDESQYISNLKSKRTKCVMRLFKKIPKRILLSGTPIKNRPIDFYAQLKFLRSDLFSNKTSYGIRYCDGKDAEWGGGQDYSGSSNLDELSRRISPFYIRRTKKEVIKDLPDKSISLRYLEMTPTERKDYKKIDEEFAAYNIKRGKSGDLIKGKNLDGKQLALIMKLSQWCAKHKTKAVIEFVQNFLETTENRKIIVFSRFIETQNILRDAFKHCGVSVMGDDKDIDRQRAVDKFQNDDSIRVFLGSTQAAGVGLTLTAADTVVFNDILFTPTDHEQAEDRAYRVGQKNNVNIYYFLFKKSIEERIFDVLNYKKRIIDQIVNTNAKDNENNIVHQEEDVLKMLVNSYLPQEPIPPA